MYIYIYVHIYIYIEREREIYRERETHLPNRFLILSTLSFMDFASLALRQVLHGQADGLPAAEAAREDGHTLRLPTYKNNNNNNINNNHINNNNK